MIKIRYLLIVMGFFSFFSMNNTFGMEVITKKEEKLNQAKKKELNYDDLVSNEIKFDNSKATRYFVGETKQQRNDGKLNNSLPVVVGDDVEKQKKAVEFAKSITPLVADKVLFFAKKYLELNKENPVFKNMTLEEYVERIYNKRMLICVDKQDRAKTREGEVIIDLIQYIGTGKEEKKLQEKNISLYKYMSYGELPIAAFFGQASKTFFINDGDRNNQMEVGKAGSYQPEGILAGLVGARFEKPDFMEYKHMVIDRDQNTVANGYGKERIKNPLLELWADFYNIDYFPAYDEIKENDPNYFKARKYDKDVYLNIAIYKERLHLSIEPFLQYANKIGEQEKKKAYVHAIGLGLGFWALHDIKQAQCMLEVYNEIIKKNKFEHISDINFSWFPTECKASIEPDANGTLNGIKIIFSKRNPSQLLNGDDKDKYLIAMYAWDSNAYFGNEYWKGVLNASGDPAAASSAATAFQIPEVNPYYNSNIKEMIKERMQQIFGDSRNAETPLALRDVKQPLSSCLNNTSVLQNDEFTPRTISLTKNLKKQTKDSKNAIQKNQEDRDDKGKEKDDNKNLSDQTPVSQSRTQIRAEGAKPKPLSSCLNKQSVLEKSNSHDKKSTTNPKQKTFFTINKKMGLVGIVFVAGVILWLWQHDYFKHLGTPSFAFH